MLGTPRKSTPKPLHNESALNKLKSNVAKRFKPPYAKIGAPPMLSTAFYNLALLLATGMQQQNHPSKLYKAL
jgi:hypothetical protein